MANAVCGVLAVLALASLSASADDPKEYVWNGVMDGKDSIQTSESTQKKWRNSLNPSGELEAFQAGSIAVWPETIQKLGASYWDGLNCYGMVFDTDAAISLYGTGMKQIGAGGVTFNKAASFCTYYYGSATKGYDVLKLTANQVWEGKNETGTATIFTGQDSGFHHNYALDPILTTANVTSWTLKGRMALLSWSPDNALQNVALRVEAPAAVYLCSYTFPASSSDSKIDEVSIGHLNAQSVTFSGAGALTKFGGSSPVSIRKTSTGGSLSSSTPTLVSAVDANTLAASVVFENGAGFDVANASVEIPSITVRDGTTTIGGSGLVMNNEACELTVEAGATLKFTAGGSVMQKIKGAGSIEVSVDGGQLLLFDLQEFTGPVSVTAGTLFLASQPAGGVTTSGTGNVRYDIITDAPVENQTITVGPGETLRVAGDGLKASSVVYMNGGTMEFLKSAVVYATISQDVSSVYRAVDDAVTMQFAGEIKLRNANDDVSNTADFRGGDIVVSGGLSSNQAYRDVFQVSAGRVHFRGADCTCHGNYKFSGTCTLCEIDGTTVQNIHWNSSGSTGGFGFYFQPSVTAQLVLTNQATLFLNSNRCLGLGNQSSSGTQCSFIVNDGCFYNQVGSYGSSSLSGTTTVEIRPGGTFASGRILTGNSPARQKIVWKGGTMKPSGWASSSSGFGVVTMTGHVPVSVEGEDCTYDLSVLTAAQAVTNAIDQSETAFWVGQEGAKLTIKGDKGSLRMNGLVPNGMKLAVDGALGIDLVICTNEFALGEFQVNVTNLNLATVASASADRSGYASTVTPAIDTVRIGAAGRWTGHELDGFNDAVYANFAFDDGALWCLERTADPLALTGTLSFGNTVRYAVTRPSGTGARVFTAATAAGGIEGSPEWIHESGSTYVPEIRGNDVVFGLKGFILFLR